jgi:hypothetical protein
MKGATALLLAAILLCSPVTWGRGSGQQPGQQPPPQGDEPPAMDQQQSPQEAEIPGDLPDLRTIASGTHIPLVIVRAPQDAEAHEGDKVYLRLRAPLRIDAHMAIPARSLVVGVLQNTSSYAFGLNTGHNGLALRLQTIVLPNHYRLAISGRVDGFVSATKDAGRPTSASNPIAGLTPEQLAAIGSFALVGGEIGSAVGKNQRGTTVGALIGAGIGVATALAINNSRLHLSAGNNVEGVLEHSLAVDPRVL